MRVGYNTNGVQNHRLEDALHLIADCGYRAVALTLDVQHLDPLRSTSRDVERIAGLLSRLELTPTIETGARFVLDPRRKHEPTLMTRDPAERARRLEFYQRCADIGRDLGAAVLSFWAGVEHDASPDREAWLVDGVARTCGVVRSRGMRPALEPEPGMAVETVADYRVVAERLGSDGPDLCLDVGHLYVTGEGDPTTIIAQNGGSLAQVHLEDMRLGVHEHLPPGEGDVDFKAIRTALERVAYEGAVCWELSRSSHCAPQAMELCLATWERAGC